MTIIPQQKTQTEHGRPSWQITPCPPWCMMQHEEGDFPADRLHASLACDLDLSQMDPVIVSDDDGIPASIVIYIEQHDREVEPRVCVYIGLDTPPLMFTPAEAALFERLFAAKLLLLETSR